MEIRPSVYMIPEVGFFHLISKLDATASLISGGTYKGRYGILNPHLSVHVTINNGDDPIHANAILDTGANACAISKDIQSLLHQDPFTDDTISGVTNTNTSNVYALKFNFGDISVENAITYVIPNSNNLGIDLVIGMNVLMLGDLAVRRDGTFEFTI